MPFQELGTMKFEINLWRNKSKRDRVKLYIYIATLLITRLSLHRASRKRG